MANFEDPSNNHGSEFFDSRYKELKSLVNELMGDGFCFKIETVSRISNSSQEKRSQYPFTMQQEFELANIIETWIGGDGMKHTVFVQVYDQSTKFPVYTSKANLLTQLINYYYKNSIEISIENFNQKQFHELLLQDFNLIIEPDRITPKGHFIVGAPWSEVPQPFLVFRRR